MDKFYLIAKSIAGELGNDLVHHTFLLMPDIDLEINGGYFVNAMKLQYYSKRSSFNKNFRPDYSPLNFDLTDTIEDESIKYDANLLHKIFLELEIDGLGYEVGIYKEATLVSSQIKVAKRLKKSRWRTISPICKQINNEIRKRYEILNT
jgi:hypothetical protein